MRLWQKISIVCIVVLLAVVAFNSALLLVNARNSVLSLTVSNAKAKQNSVAQSFSDMARKNVAEGMAPEAAKKALLDSFDLFADETCVLVHDYETLYSFVDMEPQDILFLTTVYQRVFLDEVGSRNLLIVGSLVPILDASDTYAVYIIEDITGVYQEFRSLTVRCVIAAALGILLGTFLIILLVRAQSGPLKALSISAKRIADGEYGERVNIRTRDEVGQLAEDFNRMAAAVQTHVSALEERNTRQELFIGGLTHEFKTPMTSMMLHSETLMSMDLPKEQQRISLNHIYEQCRRLERLTQKLMSLVTLEENLRPVPCSSSALLERVQASTAETLAARGTCLEIAQSGEDTVTCDPDLLQSLLINLVDNASKASEPGQTVQLRAEGHRFTVADRGRGIPPDAIRKVTDPFYMVDKSRSKKQGGSGLGLALVKRIADAHGAALSIDSTLGEGTTVTVTLP